MGKCIIPRRSGLDTSDATATASKILSGYTAYVKGSKITGNYYPPSPPHASLTVIATSHYLTVYVNGSAFDVPNGQTRTLTNLAVPCIVAMNPYENVYILSGNISRLYQVEGCYTLTGNATMDASLK